MNLRLLANAQLYSGSAEDAPATYSRALAAAQQEKPANDQPMDNWKDGLGQIYIGRGNALLKLQRTAASSAYVGSNRGSSPRKPD